MAQNLLETKKASAASMDTQSAAGPSKTAGRALIFDDGDDTDCMSSFSWQSYTDSNFVGISIRSLKVAVRVVRPTLTLVIAGNHPRHGPCRRCHACSHCHSRRHPSSLSVVEISRFSMTCCFTAGAGFGNQ
jgi:hypothetical protein